VQKFLPEDLAEELRERGATPGTSPHARDEDPGGEAVAVSIRISR